MPVKKKIQVNPVLIIRMYLYTLSGDRKGQKLVMETLGEKIRKSRNVKGLSQKKLADLLGIQYQSVQDWERDKTKPSTGKLPKLCEILDVSSTWLLSGKGAKYPEEKKISILKSPAQYGLQSESRRCVELFEKLRPEPQKIIIKLMETLIKGNRKF